MPDASKWIAIGLAAFALAGLPTSVWCDAVKQQATRPSLAPHGKPAPKTFRFQPAAIEYRNTRYQRPAWDVTFHISDKQIPADSFSAIIQDDARRFVRDLLIEGKGFITVASLSVQQERGGRVLRGALVTSLDARRVLGDVLRPAADASGTVADGPFHWLSALVGEWRAATPQHVITTTYELMANYTVLVETFSPAPGQQTLTVYHKDGPRLLATHYCAQGNQPRLRLERTSTAAQLSFLFHDATNLVRSTSSHLHRLGFAFVDDRHFTRTECYREGGKDNTEVLHFTRVR